MAGAPFDWAEYLRLATDLARNSDEASHRTSISRAYYSVYHAASALAILNGYQPGEKSHNKLWKLYAKDQNRNSRRLAQWGNTMKFIRELADYNATVPRVPDQMSQQLTYANNFLTLLAALPPNVPRP
jgi:uncharacterized protein (UPF0332 family)